MQTSGQASGQNLAQDFAQRADPYRPELLAHCYRMLGSVHDAEDLVQDTYLRAWRAFDTYDAARASVRTWLYRIATNVCLTALESRSRRPLPSGFVGRGEDPGEPYRPGLEVPWLQPLPDSLLQQTGSDPASVIGKRGSMRLALIAAMQYLPARQRATLILRDVLDFSAAETAAVLGTTTAAVNSALQRARVRLDEAGLVEDSVGEPSEAEQRAAVERYIEAFEKKDIEALKRLLTADVLLEMPPMFNWYLGRDAYAGFITIKVFGTSDAERRMVPLGVNGQPAVVLYSRDDDGVFRMHTLQVFTVTAAGISRNTVFRDAEVFASLPLPAESPDL